MTEEAPKKTSRKRAPLSKKAWAQISALWAIGEVTLTDLSDKFNVAPETISRKMKALGVTKGERAEEHAAEVKKEVEQASIDDAKVTASRIKETKEEHYRNSRALAGAAMRVLADATKKNLPLATAEPDLKAIERAIKIQDSALKQRWTILGLDKDDIDSDDLPNLQITEMTADQIIEVQRQSEKMACGVGDVSDLGMGLDMDADDIALIGEDIQSDG